VKRFGKRSCAVNEACRRSDRLRCRFLPLRVESRAGSRTLLRRT